MKGNICKRILAFTVALTMTASLNFTVIAQEISDLVNNQEAQVVSNVANEDVNEQTDITEDVCEVNGVKYPSFADALENAQDGDTIKLLADVEIAEAVKIQRDITINLNNKTMSLTRPDNYSIVIYDTLTIEGEGNVNCEGPYAIGLSTTCTGGLTVNGGTFTGSEDCVYMIGAFAGKVTINGGSFTTPYCVVNCFDGYETECEITDGEFEITGEENTLLLGHDIAVSGGTYNQPLSPDYCAEGFAPTYEDGVYTVMNEADAVCEVNGVSYPSFADALENAQDGDTIKLLADISLSETEITKNVTINGDGHTITGTTEKTFRVFANASFENLTIVNSKANARCIDTREAVEVSITNCTLTTTSKSNNQPITIGGSENGTKLTITDTTISAGVSGYGIISFVESDVEITDSTVEGYGAIYVKDGSDGSEYTITNSTIKSTNVHSGETNSFGTIVIEAEDVTVNTVNSDIVADAQGDQPQVAISLGSMNGVALNMDKDSSIESNSGYLSGYEEGQTVSVPATVADKLADEGYATTDATDGVVNVDGYADVASFKGGSLRIWAEHYETADIRFRYIIDDKLPEGAEIVSWYWNYGVSEDNLAFRADGVNTDTLDGKTISNLVLTDVKAANYKNNIYTQLVVTYTINGNEITVVDDQICSRNIYDIATAVVNDANASEAAKAYAEGLINYYAENVE